MYSKVKYYLKSNLSRPSLDFIWDDEDNKNFFTFLNDTYKQETIAKAGSQLEIKQAFQEYFEQVGYILFKLTDNQVRIKIFPYVLSPKDSKNLPILTDIIELHDSLIEYDYKGKPDQALIKEKLTLKIYDFTNSITNEKINKKELIKCAIREALSLSCTDIIIIRKDKIFIKQFDGGSKATRENGNPEQRFNGLDEEILESFYHEYFVGSDNKNFFPLVAKLYVDYYFVEQQIDNSNYEKFVFAQIQSIIKEQLINNYDHSEEFFKGFAGYVFRIHFKEVFENIADYVLAEVAISNNNMIDFLKYYSLNVVIVSGEKYKVPALEAENGLKWNVVSMLSIVKIYTKILGSIRKLKKEIYLLTEQMEVLYIGELTPIEYQRAFIREREELEDAIAHNTHELNKRSDALDMEKDNRVKNRLKAEIEKIKRILDFTNNKKAQLKSVKPSSIKKYTELKAASDYLEKEVSRESKILSQNAQAYMSIKNAITKALMSKKSRL